MQDQDPLLEFENVCISYGDPKDPDHVEVLKGVSAKVSAGQILAVVGESGSGKSTLLRATMGLLGACDYVGLKGHICGGDIRLARSSILKLTSKEMQALRGSEVEMVFQDCLASMMPTKRIVKQVLEMVDAHRSACADWAAGSGKNVCADRAASSDQNTIFDKAAGSGRNACTDHDAIINKSCKLLSTLNVAEPNRVLNSYPFELSGGLGQRVGIMMALLLEPSVLLLDEPTSALDVVSQKQVIELLLKIKSGNSCYSGRYRPAMVLVTHNIGVARALADKIIVLKDGVVEESGSACEVLDNPKSSYTKELLSAVPRLSLELPVQKTTVHTPQGHNLE